MDWTIADCVDLLWTSQDDVIEVLMKISKNRAIKKDDEAFWLISCIQMCQFEIYSQFLSVLYALFTSLSVTLKEDLNLSEA